MVLKIFSIRDSKAELYNTPFYARSNGEAERQMDRLVHDTQSQVSQYPEDYSLWYLGEVDDNSGKIQALDAPIHVVNAVQLKKTQLTPLN